MPASTPSLLVVEDNPADQFLLRRAFDRLANPPRLTFVDSGLDAVACLRGEEGWETADRPAMVLLDLNLPGLDGHGVLREIKADPGLRQIPVVILSSSTSPDDVRRAYEAHASSYLRKPMELEGFREMVEAFERFWLGVATLPA